MENDWISDETLAIIYYKELLENNDEVRTIASNTGYSTKQVLKIKGYLFGETKPCMAIVNAWRRLANGEHTHADVYMLKGVQSEMTEAYNSDSIANLKTDFSGFDTDGVPIYIHCS